MNVLYVLYFCVSVNSVFAFLSFTPLSNRSCLFLVQLPVCCVVPFLFVASVIALLFMLAFSHIYLFYTCSYCSMSFYLLVILIC